MRPLKVTPEGRTLSIIASAYLLALGLIAATGGLDAPIEYALTEVFGLAISAEKLSIGTTVVGFLTMLAGFALSFRVPPRELDALDPSTGRVVPE